MTHPDSDEKSTTWGNDANPETTPADDGAPESNPATLEQQLEQAKSEARENLDRFVRERAELENFKRRMQREKSEALRYACEPLLRDLLPVVDNLERALQHAAPDDPLVAGVKYVLDGMIEALGKHGVVRIDASGQKFDPNLHQAMARVESDEQEPNTVRDQHASGYKLHDRLLRPAMVTVSAQKSGGPVETPGDSD